MSNEERACPKCGSTKSKNVRDTQGNPTVFIVWKNDKNEEIAKIVICAECGTVYDAIKEVKKDEL